MKLIAAFREKRPRILMLKAACLLFFAVCCACGVRVQAQTQQQKGEACPLSSDRYEAEGYTVRSISIETPLDFVRVVRKPLAAKLQQSQLALATQNRGLKLNEAFSNFGYTELLADLTNRIGTLEPDERFKFVATVPALEHCDETTKQLDVVYWVVSSGPISTLVGFFEKKNDRLTREFAPGAFSKLTGKFLPQPFGGYNRSRSIFAGTKAAYRFANDFINKIDLDASGSGSSATGDFALAGSKDFGRGLVSHAEWRVGYRYANVPSDVVRLKDGTFLAQLFAATRPLGKHDLIVRFGSSIEGGNRQSNLAQSLLPPSTLANSGYGAAKIYVGSTLNLGRQSWTASYGLQVGANSRSFRADYLKQLVDTSYSRRFLLRDHLPLRLDAQFNAGHIHASLGAVPLAERFFGGNSTREFVQGYDWQIRSTPYIRSFPQNRFNRIGAGLPIGGEHFLSASFTVAQTVWSRPAIPDELLRDVRVKQAIGGQLAGSRLFAVASYLSETDEFQALKETLKQDTDPILKNLENDLRTINPDAIAIDRDEFIAEIERVRDRIAERERDEDTAEVKPAPLEFSQIRSLAIGFNGMPETSKLGGLIQSVNNDILTPLAEVGLNEIHNRVKAQNDRLEESRQAIAKEYEGVANLARTDPQELTQAKAPLNEVAAHLERLATILDEMEIQTTNLSLTSKEEVAVAIMRARSYVNTAKASIEAAGGADADIARNNLHLLAVGFGPVAPAMLAEVERYVTEMQKPLARAGLESQGRELSAAVPGLPALQKQIKEGLQRVTVSDVERKAEQDVAYTARILDVTFRELNLIAFSPVAMFDVAGVGGRNVSGFGGTRYGVGGGLRMSVVSLDLTAGYSWNLHPRAGEGRGAFVFSLDISDLFR